jgi:GNAT superfamily N-acetyltransferase
VSDPAAFTVAAVPLDATSELRRRVLRPDRPRSSVTWSAFEVDGAATFAVLDVDGEAVSTVTVMPEGCPWLPEASVPWRLRGMATEEHLRGRGLGRLVVDAAVDHVVGLGATVLWCNARVRAVAFYRRAGFTVDGEEFDVAGIGPHRPMSRRLR